MPVEPTAPAYRPSSQGAAVVTVLLTGATSGIGLALARQLGAAGHTLLLTARDKEKAGRLEEELAASGISGAHVATVDLADYATLGPFLEQMQRLPAPDVTVSNAGVHVPGREVRTTDGVELHEQVNVRSTGAMAVALAMRHPAMRLVLVGSNAYRMAQLRLRVGTSFWWRYAVSKHRAIVLFQALAAARPAAPVVALSPGSVLTDVHRHKASLVRRLNKARGLYISPDEAASEILPIVLDEDPQAFWFDRGAATPITFHRDVDRMLPDIWAPVREVLALHLGIDADLSLTHAGLVGRVGAPATAPDVEGLSDLVARARMDGTGIGVEGTRHSYNRDWIGAPIQVTADAFRAPAVVNVDQGTATVGAGRTVGEVLEDLHAAGVTLPFAGNHGAQTIAGALSTGTHGYWRNGGVLSELVEAATLVDGTGTLRTVEEGDELRAARLGLGLLGVLTSVTLRVVPTGQLVRWSLRRVAADEFWAAQQAMTREHEYLRMFEQHQAPGLVTWLAIDPTDEATGHVAFIERGIDVPAPLLARLRQVVQGRVGSFVIPRVDIDTDHVVPFSADLFVKAGVSTTRFEWPTRLLYSIFNNDRTHNMEIGVPVAGLRAFIDLLHEEAARQSDLDWYWTGRFCGGSGATLLAPNRDQDTWFVDLHVTRESSSAHAFLEAVGHAAIHEHGARLHWGKVLVGGPDELLRNHAPDVRERFERVRRALDPDGVFATEFGRRHLGA